MSILKLSVQEIRCFKNLTTIDFAVPDSINNGSGLNMLVGPNNSGKSSLIETLYLANNNLEMIPSSIRNSQSTNGIKIKLNFTNGNTKKLISMQNNLAFINNIYVNNKGEKILDNSLLLIFFLQKEILVLIYHLTHPVGKTFYIIMVAIIIGKIIYLII